MKTRLKITLAALGFAGLGACIAFAQPVIAPQVSQINPGDLFQDVVNGVPQAGNVYANALLLGNYGATQAGNNAENALIGGDMGTNLFAYGATVSTITTTSTFVANRWFAWSGTSTTIGGAQETGAADIPSSYEASLRITRTGAGVLQSCVGQVVESINAYAFQGATAEFDAHAYAGSGFSGASLQMYIVTGTGTDEGHAKMAFGINGGNTAEANVGWTGQINYGPFAAPISTGGWARFTAAAPIGSGIKEIGVALCWTPVGASPSSDYFEFTGAQLTRNSALTTVAGSSGALLATNDTRAKAFLRRPQEIETALQQRYYWLINEAASTDVQIALGQATGTGVARYLIANPVTMRTTPTVIATLGTLATTNSTGTSEAIGALVALPSGSGPSAISLQASGVTGSPLTAGNVTVLEAGNSTGGGVIGANAEE
jgi:hypothetical protein